VEERTGGGLCARINRTTRPTAQRNGLHALGVGNDRIYVDHGLTGTNRDYLRLRLALAAFRACDTLVVTKLGRHLVGMQHPAERQLRRFADPCIMGDFRASLDTMTSLTCRRSPCSM
jgi:hypothetical protein